MAAAGLSRNWGFAADDVQQRYNQQVQHAGSQDIPQGDVREREYGDRPDAGEQFWKRRGRSDQDQSYPGAPHASLFGQDVAVKGQLGPGKDYDSRSSKEQNPGHK